MRVEHGCVHGLLGGNGAGKSTLIKVVAGAIRPDAGSISIDGKPVTPASPTEMQSVGVRTIYQDLELIDNLSVRENVLLGDLSSASNVFGFIDWSAIDKRLDQIRSLFPRDSFPDVAAEVGSLPMRDRYLVAVARALASDPRVLVMDEPTAGLDHEDVDGLIDIIRQLKRSGVAVILVTHRLSEVERVCDEVTVLQDGSVVGQGHTAEITREQLTGWISKDVVKHSPRENGGGSEGAAVSNLLEVEIQEAGKLRDVKFAVSAAEVLGVAGLVGAGRTTLLLALYGAVPIQSGHLRIDGEAYAPREPLDAIGQGLALLPKDRLRRGLIATHSVMENLTLQSLRRKPIRAGFGALRIGAERRAAAVLAEEYEVVFAKLDQPVTDLSGGNQQRVVLARAGASSPRLWLLNQPTAGLDVGAQARLAAMIAQLVDTGASVIVVDEDLEFLLPVSDRILVLRHGTVAAELPGDTTAEEVIGYAQD